MSDIIDELLERVRVEVRISDAQMAAALRRIDAALGRITDAEVERDAALARATTAEAGIVAAQLVIDQLRDQLEHPTPPAPPRADTTIGATVNTRNGQTIAAAVTAWEATHGPLGVARCFNGNLPTTLATSNAATHVGKRHIILSVKPSGTEPTAAYWDKLIASYPTGTGKMLALAVNHEPENDGTAMSPAIYKRRSDLMADRIVASKRDDVIPACVLMSYLEDDNNPDTSSSAYFPTNPSRFVLLLDPYDPLNKRSLQSKAELTTALWFAAGGVWWGIAETGSKRTGAALATWVREALAWCHDNGALFVCWFHSAVGNDGPWWFDDPTGSAEWKKNAPVITA